MRDARLWLLGLLCLIGLSGCGDFPTPFKGNPGATATRLAQPTAPLLVVPPLDAAFLPKGAGQALADQLAAALQAEEVPAQAKRAQSSDWRLLSRLEPRDRLVVPVFTVKDPTGADLGTTEVAGATAAAWAAADPAVLRRVANEAAPRVAALLTGIRIARDKADPNSLLNRPAKVLVPEVTGAPGDGNQSLTRHVRAHLTSLGLVVQVTPEGADFLVRGDVVVAPLPRKLERVEIVWTVSTPARPGKPADERGKVVQLNEIPAGSLSGYWGDIALVVGTEAAGGINDVIARQTGKEEAAAADAKQAPPARKPGL